MLMTEDLKYFHNLTRELFINAAPRHVAGPWGERPPEIFQTSYQQIIFYFLTTNFMLKPPQKKKSWPRDWLHPKLQFSGANY